MSMVEMDYFEKYKIAENVYAGTNSFNGTTWSVNGNGRAIDAQVRVGNKIVHQKVFSYDHLIGAFRKRRHAQMMLEALRWAAF